VALNVRGEIPERSQLIWNVPSKSETKDYRLEGENQAIVNWPDPTIENHIKIIGVNKKI